MYERGMDAPEPDPTVMPGDDELLDTGPFDLTGQVALVTGGNGGIGLGLAEGLVLAGASVAISGRNQDKTAAALEHLDQLVPGAPVVGFVADVAVESDVVSLVRQTVEHFGRLDSCVANAGTSADSAILDLSLDQWRSVMSVNLDGVFLTLREAARQMVAQGGGGALVAVSSTSSEHGAPRNAHYAASKAAVQALVRSMAVALARERIRANSLVPGVDADRPDRSRVRVRQVPREHDPADSGAALGRAGRLPHRGAVPVRPPEPVPHRRRGHPRRRLHRLLTRSPTAPASSVGLVRVAMGAAHGPGATRTAARWVESGGSAGSGWRGDRPRSWCHPDAVRPPAGDRCPGDGLRSPDGPRPRGDHVGSTR